MYKARIATHLTPEEIEATYQMIKEEAVNLTEEQVTEKVQALMAEADKWNDMMVHDPKMQDSRDRMYGRWVAEASEMATMWVRVS